LAEQPQTHITPPVLTGCEAVRAEASKYSGWNVNLMVAISKAESNCRAEARGDGHLTYQKNGRAYGYSVGVFQIRILEGREHCDTYDLSINVKCAYNIYKGQGYKAWSVYNNGKYKKHL